MSANLASPRKSAWQMLASPRKSAWQMSASPRKTVWQMLASLASPRKTAWQMSVSLVSPNIFRFLGIYYLPDLLNSPNLPNLEKNVVLAPFFSKLSFGKCHRVWRVLPKLLGKCQRVWWVWHISEKAILVNARTHQNGYFVLSTCTR